MTEFLVVNASPLIFLSRGQHLELLPHFASHIIVPDAVASEILSRGPHDITARALREHDWIEVAPPVQIPDAITAWGLGTGESSVLAYAVCHGMHEVLLDDLAARRCANSLNIPVRGTLGIVLAAKNRGLVSSARAIMNDLIQGGMYLSSDVLNEALRRVGE